MAEDKQAEGLDEEVVKDKSEEVAEQFAEADKQADPNETTVSVQEIASELGWVPQDKFKGPAEKWKPAEQFIRDGRDIQERSSRELKEIRTTLETIKATSGAIMADKLREQHATLAQQYADAVEKGDPDKAWQAANAISSLQARANTPEPVASPAPETERWVQKNNRIMNDPLAAQRALQVCDAYARAGQPVDQQLSNTEAVMRREFPHLFDDKPAPVVSAPGSRSSAGPAKGPNTAANLPKEAKEYGQDLVDRGLVLNMDAFAKHYFEQSEKRK
jgi:hypothetical protein